jgi:putative transposase
VICAFIDAHKDQYGVEPICRVLTEHGCPIAPSTYYDARSRPPSARALRDSELKKEIAVIHQENYFVYGAHKVWIALRRKGIDVARCTVERLMRELGLRGVLRGRPPRTTQSDSTAARAADRVHRKFNPLAPNQLWVADFTYVRTMMGWVYVAFVIDAYARRILGWKVSTRMTTPLVLAAINQAIWVRRTEGITDLSGLTHHNDAGSQGGFNWSSQHLDLGGARRGDSRLEQEDQRHSRGSSSAVASRSGSSASDAFARAAGALPGGAA